MLLYALIVIIVLLMCQLIGYWVNNNIPQNTSIEINDFLRFTHIRNFGGIFGLAQNMGWLFALISVLLLDGVSYICGYIRQRKNMNTSALALLSEVD